MLLRPDRGPPTLNLARERASPSVNEGLARFAYPARACGMRRGAGERIGALGGGWGGGARVGSQVELYLIGTECFTGAVARAESSLAGFGKRFALGFRMEPYQSLLPPAGARRGQVSGACGLGTCSRRTPRRTRQRVWRGQCQEGTDAAWIRHRRWQSRRQFERPAAGAGRALTRATGPGGPRSPVVRAAAAAARWAARALMPPGSTR